MTKRKDKWKEFAILHALSGWDEEKVNAVELFDAISAADYDETAAVFDKYAVLRWEPFENQSINDTADMIESLARKSGMDSTCIRTLK